MSLTIPEICKNIFGLISKGTTHEDIEKSLEELGNPHVDPRLRGAIKRAVDKKDPAACKTLLERYLDAQSKRYEPQIEDTVMRVFGKERPDYAEDDEAEDSLSEPVDPKKPVMSWLACMGNPADLVKYVEDMVSFTDLTAYLVFTPIDQREKILKLLSEDIIKKLIAMVANNTMSTTKMLKKRSEKAAVAIKDLLDKIKDRHSEIELTPARIAAAFGDLMFLYRCILSSKGKLKVTGNINIYEPLNYLGLSGVIDLSAWANEKLELSKLLNPNFKPSQGIEDVINKTRSQWDKILNANTIATYLQLSLNLPEKCDHHLEAGKVNKWGIIGTAEKPACGACVFKALTDAGKNPPVSLKEVSIVG